MSTKNFSITAPPGLTINLTIRRASDNYYWTGSAWQSGSATVAMTETAGLAANTSEYSSTTSPTAYAFWWAIDSNNVLWERGEYAPYSRPATTASDLAASLADLKIYLNIDSDNTDRDDLLNDARASAATRIERYCQRNFASASRTYYLDGTGTTKIFVPDYPITAITSIHCDTEYPRSWDAADLVDSDSYQVKYDSSDHMDEWKYAIQRIDGSKWERGEQNHRVIATTGYSTIPDDLYMAATEFAAHIFLTAENKRIGLTSKSEQGGSIGYDIERSAIPAAVMDKINPYRSWRAFGF